MEFLYIDGENLCVYTDGKVKSYQSRYIQNYKESSLREAKSKEWKQKGRTEMLLNEGMLFEDEELTTALTSLSRAENKEELYYTFSANETSGIYKKYLDDKKNTEAHVISSNEVEFSCLHIGKNGKLLAAVKRGGVESNIALFSDNYDDYQVLTGGDSLDENPSFDGNGNILFNSYGVGRDENNRFVEYAPSGIYRLNAYDYSLQTVLESEEYSFVKPIEREDGLYYLKRPAKEKERSNPILEICMIPVRILQGIVGFISFFVTIFSGKPLVKGGKQGGGAAARNYSKDERKLYIQNQMVKVDRELKKNGKEEDYGFIPRSWKLARLTANGEEELAYGVADYCFCEDGIVVTNGKHIFLIENGKRKKIADVDCCLKLAN